MLALLISALALPLASCNASFGGQAGGASLASNQTFTWPYVTPSGRFGHNEILDPAQVATGADAGTISMLYMGLVTYGPNLKIIGDAARTWDVDSTGTIYTFHLRPNLFFSDGKPITAADFAYSIDRALDPNLCPVYSAKTYNANGECAQEGSTYLTHILGAGDRLKSGGLDTIIATGDDPRKGLNVLDAQTLSIRLDAPISYFLQALTYPDADVLEKSFVETPAYAGGLWVDHLDKGGTSGPFLLKSYGDGSTMTFVPNPYWEKAFGNLTLKQVIRPAIASQDSEYSNYRSGAFDYTDVPNVQYRSARGQSDFHSIPELETDYFGLNTKLAPFDNIYVRQAFDLALNKQSMVDNIEYGAAAPTNHIVPQGMPGFNVGLTNPAPDGTQSLTSNVPAALSLLRKAQATCPAPGTVTSAPDYCAYITGSSPAVISLNIRDNDKTVEALAKTATAMWSSALGLNVTYKKIPWVSANQVTQPSLIGYLLGPQSQNRMQMWEVRWLADYNDPQDWLTILFSTGAFYNGEGFSDPKLDALMAKADIEQDATKRMQMYNQAEQAIVDACVWIPFQQPNLYWRQREYVHGFGFNTIGLMVDQNWTKVYIAQH